MCKICKGKNCMAIMAWAWTIMKSGLFFKPFPFILSMNASLILPHPSSAPPPCVSMPMSKPSSKLSRSLSKILRSLFRSKPNSNSSIFLTRDQPKDGFYVFYEVGSLSTIPEVPEADFGAGLSPEISSLVKKTASERFMPNSLRISCSLNIWISRLYLLEIICAIIMFLCTHFFSFFFLVIFF